MLVRIIVGLIVCAVGYLMVWKPGAFYEFIGPLGFAEKLFMGGSKSFYKMFGIVVILIGFLVVTNLHVAFFGGLFSFFFG